MPHSAKTSMIVRTLTPCLDSSVHVRFSTSRRPFPRCPLARLLAFQPSPLTPPRSRAANALISNPITSHTPSHEANGDKLLVGPWRCSIIANAKEHKSTITIQKAKLMQTKTTNEGFAIASSIPDDRVCHPCRAKAFLKAFLLPEESSSPLPHLRNCLYP